MDKTSMIIEIASMRSWWSKDLALEANLKSMFARVRAQGASMGWVTQDEQLFRCVVGAALLEASEPDKAWLLAHLEGLAAISHALRGAELGVVGSESLAIAHQALEAVPARPYALMGLWHASKDA